MGFNPITKEEYVADTHGGPLTMRLRCDCGHVWEIPISEFQGRRKTRFCGRAECPHNPARTPAKAPRETKAAYCVYLPEALVQGVRSWGSARGLPLSRAIAELLREALESK